MSDDAHLQSLTQYYAALCPYEPEWVHEHLASERLELERVTSRLRKERDLFFSRLCRYEVPPTLSESHAHTEIQ